MADEVKVRAFLGLVFGGTSDGLGVSEEPPDEETFDFAGDTGDGLARYRHFVQQVGTASEEIDAGDDVDAGGYLLVKNLGATSVNMYAISGGGVSTIFATLATGQVALFPTGTNAFPSVRCLSGSTKIEVFVISGPVPV